MAQLTLTLRVVKPWWFRVAVYARAVPMVVRLLVSGQGPSDDEWRSFGDRCANWLKVEAVKHEGGRSEGPEPSTCRPVRPLLVH